MDNGSTDGTASYLTAAQMEDPRVRMVRLPENLGYGQAMRLAVAEVRGRSVAFLDADDLMRPDRLARQSRWLDSHPEFTAVFADAEPIDSEGRSLGRRVFAAGSEQALRRFAEFSMPACHSTGCVRSDVFREVACTAYLRQASDFDLVCRLLERGRIGFMDEIVGAYRRHPNQVSETGRVLQACEGAAVGLMAARRRAGLLEDSTGIRAWVDTLKLTATCVGAVHAAFAVRAGQEGFARLELYHARRAVRRGRVGSLLHVITALLARRAYAGSLRERYTLAVAGPLRLSGVNRR